MTRNSWFKFYPNDWLSDPNLNMCSYAAKGIWMDLICLAHNSEKYGFLIVNGRNLDEKSLKKVLKLTKKGLKPFSELVKNGVIGIAEDGSYYSRRLLKEKRLADEARKFGMLGGNPRLKGRVNPPVKDRDILELRVKSKEGENAHERVEQPPPCQISR